MFCKKCGKELNNGAKVCPNCGTKVTLANALTDIFKNGRQIWVKEGELTSTDCFASPQIPEEAKSAARMNFGINYSEQILFIRDSSFWNSRNQGLVITDGGIYCIPDNDKPEEKIILGWDILKFVEYKDLVLYFWGYGDENDNCPIHISYFMKNSDDEYKARRIGISLAQTFTSMARCVEPEADPFDIAWDHYEQLFDHGKIEEALQFALSCKDQEGLTAFYAIAANLYATKGEPIKGIALLDEGLKLCEPESGLATWFNYYKYSAYVELKNAIEARKYCLPVIQNATDDMKRNDGLSIKEDAMNDLEILDKEYIAHYLELPYNKRKVLLPVSSYTDLCQDYLSVIDIKKLSDSGIVFPIGHPVAYQLYVGHPYIKQKYLPFESYELELIEDKVREFCQLVQCLGATEITIECLNSFSSDRNTNTEQHISGDVSYRVASVSGKNNRDQSQHLIDEISQSINLHQKFVPNGKPHLPEDLVWYHNEPSWQRLYNQRMQGALLQHEERIETRKNRVLEGSELNSIEGEFKSLFLAANGQWNKKIEEKFELRENAVLAIHVQFASLHDLETQTSSANTFSFSQYTESEKEYLEELKNCLEENNEISSGERRLLEKLRKHLGISEERALELEEYLKPSLTEDEKEYLEEYRYCLASGNEISASERRLLDKLRNRLGISEDRAKNIECLIK